MVNNKGKLHLKKTYRSLDFAFKYYTKPAFQHMLKNLPFPLKIKNEFNRLALVCLFSIVLKDAERIHIKDVITVIYLTTISSLHI